jgi:hypothetical protein
MEEIRLYWRYPWLASELPKEEREKLTEKFMKLLEKDREKNVEWFSNVMKERNKNLPRTCARDY